MANSRKPGPLQSPSGMWMIPARTPGPMGMFDQGDPNVTTALGDTPGPLGHNDANDPSISIFGPALGVPRRLSPLAELNAGSRVRAMSHGEAFFTFHPVGRALHGYAESALAITRSPLTLAEGVGNLLNDAYGYSRDWVAGPKTGVMGDARPYSAASGLLQSIQRDGWLGTTGNIVRGTILSLPGIAQIDAINRRDPHAFGASLPVTFLALSGRMAVGQSGAIRSGGTIAKGGASEAALARSASNASGTRAGPTAALGPEGKPKGKEPEVGVGPNALTRAVDNDISASNVTSTLSTRTSFSGHGAYESGAGGTVVPNGTTFTVYAEHGATISDPLGNAIETGGDVSKMYSKTYQPGDTVHNYTLYPPAGLNIMGGETVASPTSLSSLLKPNMGDVHWAACTYVDGSPASTLMYHTDGVYETFGTGSTEFWKKVKTY